MIQLLKQFVLIFITSLFLFSCGKKNQGSSPSVDSGTDVLTASKLTASSWCYAENINDDFHVVSRFNFSGKGTVGNINHFKLDYLRIEPDQDVQVHNSQNENEWLLKDLELVEDLSQISTLENYLKQEVFFDETLRSHSHIKTSAEKFSPKLAIIIISNSSEFKKTKKSRLSLRELLTVFSYKQTIASHE